MDFAIVGMIGAVVSCVVWGTSGIRDGSAAEAGSDKACLFADVCDTAACGDRIGAATVGGAGNLILLMLIPASSRSTGIFASTLSGACIEDGWPGIAATGSAAILSRQ